MQKSFFLPRLVILLAFCLLCSEAKSEQSCQDGCLAGITYASKKCASLINPSSPGAQPIQESIQQGLEAACSQASSGIMGTKECRNSCDSIVDSVESEVGCVEWFALQPGAEEMCQCMKHHFKGYVRWG